MLDAEQRAQSLMKSKYAQIKDYVNKDYSKDGGNWRLLSLKQKFDEQLEAKVSAELKAETKLSDMLMLYNNFGICA
jgi:hypothetical protein